MPPPPSLSVTAASSTRIPHTKLQRLENAGLVVRDTSHPVRTGQPVTLTDAGRAALFVSRRTGIAKAAPRGSARLGTSSAEPVQRY